MKKLFQNILCAGILVSSFSLYPFSVKAPETLATWLQDFTYQDEEIDYWKSPKETVKDKGGDCEDFAILVDFVLSDLGYDVTFLGIDFKDGGASHAIAVIKINDKYTMFSNNGYFTEPYNNLRTMITAYYSSWSKLYLLNINMPGKGVVVDER